MSTWTIKDVLSWAVDDFKSRGIDNPRLEAEVLLSHVLDYTRLDLYTKFDRPLNNDEREQFKNIIKRRRFGEPCAYITGKKEFWSLDFEVNRRVLIPRPETELLVEAALDLAPSCTKALDLCTGSGCVAVALAKELSDLSVNAVDISKDAVETAMANAKKHGLDNRVRFFFGDLFEPVPSNESYQLITANPPYVKSSELALLALEVRAEPVLALDGGADGLDVVKRIIENAPKYLEPGGVLLIEIDPRQADYVASELGPLRFGAKGTTKKDLAGQERVVIFNLDR